MSIEDAEKISSGVYASRLCGAILDGGIGLQLIAVVSADGGTESLAHGNLVPLQDARDDLRRETHERGGATRLQESPRSVRVGQDWRALRIAPSISDSK